MLKATLEIYLYGTIRGLDIVAGSVINSVDERI